MRAVVLREFGGPDTLQLTELPRPTIAPHNEVLIEVRAAALNAFDGKLRRGELTQYFPLPPAHVPGCDVAGIVVERGFDVGDLKVGDRVYGILDPLRPGAYAEYAATKAWLVRRMPVNLDFRQAAALPMAGCTAWTGLVDLAKVGPGTRVLITGAGGCVGNFALQLAKYRGAWVAAWVGPDRGCAIDPAAADLILDCPSIALGDALERVDVVLDTVGGDVNRAGYAALKPGGMMLVVVRRDRQELAERAMLAERHQVAVREVIFEARPDVLERLRPLFEEGRLVPPPIRSYPLAAAAEAHRELERGGVGAKIVLEPRTQGG